MNVSKTSEYFNRIMTMKIDQKIWYENTNIWYHLTISCSTDISPPPKKAPRSDSSMLDNASQCIMCQMLIFEILQYTYYITQNFIYHHTYHLIGYKPRALTRIASLCMTRFLPRNFSTINDVWRIVNLSDSSQI